MWYDAIRKYDGCRGLEIFVDYGAGCTTKIIGEIKPLIKTKIGDLYSFIEYDRFIRPLWRCMFRQNGNDNYLWTSMELEHETQRVSVANAVIFLRHTMVLIIEEDNIRTYAMQANYLDGIEAREIALLGNITAIVKKLEEYGYKEVWFNNL
jgi:hypothetical protein